MVVAACACAVCPATVASACGAPAVKPASRSDDKTRISAQLQCLFALRIHVALPEGWRQGTQVSVYVWHVRVPDAAMES
jgi:hypothetical protein